MWQMELNVLKTKTTVFTTSNTIVECHYTLKNMLIKTVPNVKYLGINLTLDISWKSRIDEVVSKASRALGFFRHNHHSSNTDTKLLPQTRLVRSKIKYASIIWNPHKLFLINKLESLQNKAVHFIVRKQSPTFSVTEVKTSLKLPCTCRSQVSGTTVFFPKTFIIVIHPSPPVTSCQLIVFFLDWTIPLKCSLYMHELTTFFTRCFLLVPDTGMSSQKMLDVLPIMLHCQQIRGHILMTITDFVSYLYHFQIQFTCVVLLFYFSVLYF